MASAIEIARRRAAAVQESTRQRIAAGEQVTLETTMRDGGDVTCAECSNHHMRKMQVGITTITIGKPELRCTVDGSFRSPEIKRNCNRFVRGNGV